MPSAAKNVLGTPLQPCCYNPRTGFYRDGYCRTGSQDFGVHAVCAQMTQEFLEYSRSRGNDLVTPHPPSFPGLKHGDKWCLCANRWLEALDAGVAPPIVLQASHEILLEYKTLDELKPFALDWDQERNQVIILTDHLNGN